MRWLLLPLLLMLGLVTSPNGPTIDPNGLHAPVGPTMDPNGLTVPGEGGGGFDPLG